MCAGTSGEAPRCEAIVANDEKRCDALVREAARARCRRDTKRWASLLASTPTDAATSPTTPVTAKLEIHAIEGTTEPAAPIVDVRDDFARGVVLVEQLDGTRVDVGDLRELQTSTGFYAPTPLARAHAGATLFIARGAALTRVESTELGVPGAATLLTPIARSTLKATLAKLDHVRGAEVKLTLEGELANAAHGYRVKLEIVTFVRDVVKPGAAPTLLFPLLDAGRR
jgi:hypothetical protein